MLSATQERKLLSAAPADQHMKSTGHKYVNKQPLQVKITPTKKLQRLPCMLESPLIPPQFVAKDCNCPVFVG